MNVFTAEAQSFRRETRRKNKKSQRSSAVSLRLSGEKS